MGLFGRRKVPPPTPAPAPCYPYAVAAGPAGGWAPFNPQAQPNAQVGRYAMPYGVPTQAAAYWPDVQKKCGVEGIRPWWTVLTASDIPYWQQTAVGPNPAVVMKAGGNPGPQLGPAQVSRLLGPQRLAASKQLAAVANGIGGW